MSVPRPSLQSGLSGRRQTARVHAFTEHMVLLVDVGAGVGLNVLLLSVTVGLPVGLEVGAVGLGTDVYVNLTNHNTKGLC